MKINKNDFRFMRGGASYEPLKADDLALMQAINHQRPGKKRALILLHGFASSPAVFRLIINKLKHYDAIICPILPGHAENFDVFASVRSCAWVSEVEEQCESLVKEYTHVDVLGLSLGGLLACHLAQRYTLNHLYLLAPALCLYLPLNASLILFNMLNTFGFNAFYNAGANIKAPNYKDISYRKIPIKTLIEIFSLIKGFNFIQPSCPTDLFLGKYDEVVNSEKVAERFASNPQVVTHWLEQSAHLLPLDTDYSEIIACINAHDP